MEIRVPTKVKDQQIFESFEMFEIMQKILQREERIMQQVEHFWVIGIAVDKKISFIELVALGKADLDHLEIGDVFHLCLSKDCQELYLVHNHRSRDIKPNEDEMDMTDKLYQTARFLKLQIADHLIITAESYYSYREQGLFEQLHQSKKFMIKAIAEEIYRYEGKLDMAKKLLDQGVDLNIIADASGLSIDKIKNL